MKIFKLFFFSMLFISVFGCTSYQPIRNVKLLSLDGRTSKGQLVGEVTGTSCRWHILGYSISPEPTVSDALRNTRLQKYDGFYTKMKHQIIGQESELLKSRLSYLNNVNIKESGYNAYLFGTNCISVAALGYKYE